MKEKKEISYRKQIRNRYIINGLAWTLVGAIGLVNTSAGSGIYQWLQIPFLAIAVYMQLSLFIREKEKADEMAIKNLQRSISVAFDATHILLFSVAIGMTVFGNLKTTAVMNTINLTQYIEPVIFIIVGLPEIVAGLFFNALEDE